MGRKAVVELRRIRAAAIECSGGASRIELQSKTERSRGTSRTTGECRALKPLRGYPAELLEAGGVVEYLRRQQPELDGR